MAGKPKFAESRARYHLREQAAKRGWNLQHLSAGGDFLEENEIVGHFSDIGLGLERPDFLLCVVGDPAVVVEAKNEAGKSAVAIAEAITYAELVNATGMYSVRLAIGASGNEEQGFVIVVRYLTGTGWEALTANGFELTSFPSRREVELALAAGDASTSVTVPSQAEFIEAAIEVSRILRQARVEASARPKVIGALVLALYESSLGLTVQQAGAEDDAVTDPHDPHDPPGPLTTGAGPADVHHLDLTLQDINELVRGAVDEAVGLADERREDLVEALRLSGAAYEQLGPRLGRLVAVLRRLNVRAVMHTGVDFLGTFYEAFLRYGYDNNTLGIVFTPRHITRLCAELAEVGHADRVIDIACGTGGFLVSAFDVMMEKAPSEEARAKARDSLYGFDTNPTVWALALLNMYFRGDGKSNIRRASSLEAQARTTVARKFSKSFLNPPFSQTDEPERQFIDAAAQALEPDGLLVVVVKAGVFADDDHKLWRAEFTRRHSILAVISLPDDLFYPTAAPTSILVARAHVPQSATDQIYLARVSNDGYEKLKGKRVERPGSELPAILDGYRSVRAGTEVADERSVTVRADRLLQGAEWSPQEWLPQSHTADAEMVVQQRFLAGSILRTVATYPEAADKLLVDFGAAWSGLPVLPYGGPALPISDLFVVANGKSSGEKNYLEGDTPYISSGDQANSIVSLVAPVAGESFESGGITVTAFGGAFVQPWPFMARGNGGSSVRVLAPRYTMSVRELLWFAAQINVQRWRFFYARMAIKSRIQRLTLEVPATALPDAGSDLAGVVQSFLTSFEEQRLLLSGGVDPTA